MSSLGSNVSELKPSPVVSKESREETSQQITEGMSESVGQSIPDSLPLMMEPMGELDGAINSLAISAKYNLTQLSPKQLLITRWHLMKSWGAFIDTNKMVFPIAIHQWSRRLIRNLQYFQSNYLCVFIILFIYCILTSPLLLLALSASLGMGYIVTLKNAEKPIKFFGRRLTLGQQYLAIAIGSLPLFYIVGAGSAVFWVIGASLFVIGFHASIYAIESVQESLEDGPFGLNVQSV